MNPVFRKSLIWSAAVHVSVITSIVLLMGFSHRPRPPKPIQWFDLQAEGGPSRTVSAPAPGAPEPPGTAEPPPVESAPEPPAPKPDLPPQPESIAEPSIKKIPPSKTTVEPKNKKTVEPAKGKAKVVISKKKWVRSTGFAPAKGVKGATATASFDTSAFAKNLLKKLPGGGGLVAAAAVPGTGTSAEGKPDEFAWYYNHIFQEMYGAWQIPFGMAEGLSTQVLIQVEKSGVISRVTLAVPSGNPRMDESALTAANRVKKLLPLPKGLGDARANITVTFKVQKS